MNLSTGTPLQYAIDLLLNLASGLTKRLIIADLPSSAPPRSVAFTSRPKTRPASRATLAATRTVPLQASNENRPSAPALAMPPATVVTPALALVSVTCACSSV